MLRRTVLSFAEAAAKKKFQVAVVGAGPAGCYVAHNLLKLRSDVHIDLFEKLPVPFGLSRYGVAPDHPEVKNVEKTFLTMMDEKRADVSLFTNAAIGAGGLPLKALQDNYSAVVLAHGAAANRQLGVKNEGLGQVLPAKRFVEFYNTYPFPHADPKTPPIELDRARRVVIIGNGNVAIDCTRALGLGYKHFCKTDMNCFACRALMNSTIAEIVVVGRRGVEHSAFTTAEFRELATLSKHLEVVVEPFELDAAVERSKTVRGKKRMLELMHKYTPGGASAAQPSAASSEGGKAPVYPLASENDMRAAFSIYATQQGNGRGAAEASSDGPRRRVFFSYNLTPQEFIPSPVASNRVGAVRFTKPDGTDVLIPCDAVLTSIGYQATPVMGAPFDDKAHVVPNKAGRVTGGTRLYTAGWAKTGPRGVILTTMQGAQETARTISADFDAALSTDRETEQQKSSDGVRVDAAGFEDGPLGATNDGKYGLIESFVQLKMEPMSLAQVKKIWFVEKQRGIDLGKLAEKVQSVVDMVDIGGSEKRMSRRATDRFLGNAPARPPGLELMEDWLDPDTEIIDLSDPNRKNPEMNVRL